MPISKYLKALRAKVGPDLLLVPSVAVVVFDQAGRILLVQHADRGQWVVPGGSLEPGESPADAAVREMWEETGLWVEPVRLIGVYAGPEFEVVYRNGDRVTYTIIGFAARVLSGEARADGIETVRVAYVSAEQADSLDVPAFIRVILSDAFAARPEARFRPPDWRPPAGP